MVYSIHQRVLVRGDSFNRSGHNLEGPPGVVSSGGARECEDWSLGNRLGCQSVTWAPFFGRRSTPFCRRLGVENPVDPSCQASSEAFSAALDASQRPHGGKFCRSRRRISRAPEPGLSDHRWRDPVGALVYRPTRHAVTHDRLFGRPSAGSWHCRQQDWWPIVGVPIPVPFTLADDGSSQATAQCPVFPLRHLPGAMRSGARPGWLAAPSAGGRK